ncbi:MAG: hypothetical protein RIS94_757 [Pseudomonadota bacterium]|jgi:general secretion pathway protein J
MIARATPREQGFTLAESLVALAVMGLVASLLLALTDLAMRLGLGTQGRDARVDAIVTAQTLLRHRVEAMRGVVDTAGDGGSVAFMGSGTSVSFMAPAFDARGPHALQRFRIALSPQRQLALYATPGLGGADPRLASTEGWAPTPLVEAVDWVQVTYFGADRMGGSAVWQDSWQSRRELPRLIRIRVGFAAGDERAWPVLMIRPGSAMQAPCPENDGRQACGAAS